MTAPAHRVGDLRDRPPAQDPRRWWTPEWWRISRAPVPPAYRPMIIESNPPRPPLAHGATGRGVKRAGPVPGHHWSRRGPPGESMVLVVVPPKGACRGPMSSALPSHSPGARSTRPAGRAPGTSLSRAGSSPRAPVITGLSGVDLLEQAAPRPRSRATAEPHRARRRACSSPQSQSSASVLPSGLTQTIEHAPPMGQPDRAANWPERSRSG